jgi:hypothetical protein
MLSAAFYLEALLLSAIAVCYSYVLVQSGMLLAPVQAQVRKWHQQLYSSQYKTFTAEEDAQVSAWYHQDGGLDGRWWWKMLWGCPTCIAAQWGFWGYLLLGWPGYRIALEHSSLTSWITAVFVHLGFTALTLFLAAGWRAFYAWTQTIS